MGNMDITSDLSAIDILNGNYDGYDNECPNFNIILLHDTSLPEVIGITKQISIKAKIFNTSLGEPANGFPAEFEIISIKDEADNEISDPDPEDGYAKLSSKVAYTDETGLVFILFNAGTKPNIKYTVKVTGTCANEEILNIFVTDLPRGHINVCFDFDGAIPKTSINTIKLSLLSGDNTCSALFPEKPLPITLSDKTIPDIFQCTQFEYVAAEIPYTLFAAAKGPFGSLTASGCQNSVLALPNSVTNVTLKLFLVTLNPTGTYNCTDEFDFTNVLKDCSGGIYDPLDCFVGQSGMGMTQRICCSLYQIVNFFDNPGELIMSLLFDLAKQFLPSIVADIGESLLGQIIADVITNWLKTGSPEWVQNFIQKGSDITNVITNLELYSDLKLSKLNNDFTIQGTHYWKGIALSWGSDKLIFTMDDINNTEFPLNLLDGKFTASIVDWNKMILNNHKVKLNYGKLILFVINEIIIKKVTNGKANTITEAVKLWIDCAAISDGLFGEFLNVVTFGLVKKNDVENLCNNTVITVAGFATAFLGSLTLDTDMSLQGSCLMIDTDDNLKVDAMKDGKYNGFIETGEGQQSSFTGKFECTK